MNPCSDFQQFMEKMSQKQLYLPAGTPKESRWVLIGGGVKHATSRGETDISPWLRHGAKVMSWLVKFSWKYRQSVPAVRIAGQDLLEKSRERKKRTPSCLALHWKKTKKNQPQNIAAAILSPVCRCESQKYLFDRNCGELFSVWLIMQRSEDGQDSKTVAVETAQPGCLEAHPADTEQHTICIAPIPSNWQPNV